MRTRAHSCCIPFYCLATAGTEPPGAAAPPTATSTLLDRLKPMAAAVERMLNTVSCCVDRLHIHLHLPAPDPPCAPPEAPPSPDTNRHPSDRAHTQRSWCVVLSAGSVKLVDTSDCFMAPPGILGDAAVTLDPERPVEVSKSLFWDNLRMTIVPDDGAPAAQHSHGTAAAAGMPGSPRSPGGESRGDAIVRGRPLPSADGAAGIPRSPQVCDPWADFETGKGFVDPGGDSHGAATAAWPRDTPSATACGSAAGGTSAAESPLQQACHGSRPPREDGESEYSQDFRDAEEMLEDASGPGEECRGEEEEVVLFTGAGVSGWRGKATLQLAWAAVSEGGALRSVKVAVQSSEGAVVALAAEQVGALAEAAAVALAAVEQRARVRERAAAGPPVALADVTASMLDVLRPGLGMHDVLAMAAEEGGLDGGPTGARYGEASGMTEMHDARSMLASSMVVREHAPQAPEAPSWEVRLDLQPPELKAGAAEAVPAVAVSVWDSTAPGLTGSRAPVFGVIAEVGSVTACARQSAGVPLKASSRIQGVSPALAPIVLPPGGH